jgi:hypothetical protein
LRPFGVAQDMLCGRYSDSLVAASPSWALRGDIHFSFSCGVGALCLCAEIKPRKSYQSKRRGLYGACSQMLGEKIADEGAVTEGHVVADVVAAFE